MIRSLLLSLVSHRTAALLRWDSHFLGVRALGLARRTARQLANHILQSERPLFLNLGSGPRGLASPHWINVDGYHDANVHHLMDLARALPIPSNSFDGIFSEHVQEHFTLHDGTALLRECLRVLKPGGRIRLIMPDAERIIDTYLRAPHTLLAHRPVASNEAMEAVNTYFYQRYEHQCLYDFGLAKYVLEAAGFASVRRVAFGVGEGPRELVIDDPKYAWESLYVEASKPNSHRGCAF